MVVLKFNLQTSVIVVKAKIKVRRTIVASLALETGATFVMLPFNYYRLFLVLLVFV